MSSALLSYEEAAREVAAFAALRTPSKPRTERLALVGVSGRVLAQALVADEDQPPFARSTRDGFACRALEVSAHGLLPVAGAIHAGEAPPGPLPPGAAWEIMTGAPVPAGADTVVMIEHVERVGDAMRLLPPRAMGEGDNIVAQGAQARAGDVLLEPGTVLGPAQIALAATCGYGELAVRARPRVAILTTGDELVPVSAKPEPGQIRNSNAPMLAALVAAAGGEPWVLPAAADTAEALDAALAEAAQADLLLISGGVSAGKFDLVEPALARRGARFFFTGVRMRPGKPLVFGEIPRDGETLPFFGLPGNPVSSAVTFLLFGATVLKALAGEEPQGPRLALARLAAHVEGKSGLTRFLPGRWESGLPAGQMPQAAAVQWQGSGDLAAFARANCFLVVPEQSASLEPGELVRILIF